MQQTLLPPLPWYRHRWPWLVMLGPFLVVLAGSYTAWLAFTREDALVVGDYYKQGQAINQDLRRDRAASVLGLDAVLHYDAATGRLAGRVLSHGNAYRSPVRLHLAHATLPERDIALTLRPDEQGNVDIALPAFAPSRWQLTLEDTARSWRLAGTWRWPGSAEVALRADGEN